MEVFKSISNTLASKIGLKRAHSGERDDYPETKRPRIHDAVAGHGSAKVGDRNLEAQSLQIRRRKPSANPRVLRYIAETRLAAEEVMDSLEPPSLLNYTSRLADAADVKPLRMPKPPVKAITSVTIGIQGPTSKILLSSSEDQGGTFDVVRSGV